MFLSASKQHLIKPIVLTTESKYDKRQDKGPVYPPLREKPFSRKTMKV